MIAPLVRRNGVPQRQWTTKKTRAPCRLANRKLYDHRRHYSLKFEVLSEGMNAKRLYMNTASQIRHKTRINGSTSRKQWARRVILTRADANEGNEEQSATNRNEIEDIGTSLKSSAALLTETENRMQGLKPMSEFDDDDDKSAVQKFLFPDKDELPDEVEMSIWEHLEELRQRVFVSVIGVGAIILVCFGYSKQLIQVLESPVAEQGVKFLQLSPGEFFFTSFKVLFHSF